MPIRARHALLAATLAALVVPSHAGAATFTPTTTADGINGSCGPPGPCTLRDAIVAANAAPGNEVSIPAGNYTISMGQLVINNDMTIAGAGARTTTIDAQGTSRVFNLDGDPATIRDLTIRGGAAVTPGPGFGGEGGGILADANLILQRSVVIGNTASFTGGGISAPFKGNGGLTTIEDSLIANNTVTGGLGAGSGGGLNLFGDANITNSTVTGNSVSNAGYNQGGGVTSAEAAGGPPGAGVLTLTNSTIAGNSITTAGGGMGAGLSGDDFISDFPIPVPPILTALNAKNSIVAGNTSGGATMDCALVTVVSTTNNLSSDATCGFADAGSKQNSNPQLGALANNGGPTDTRALSDDSPALNTGTNAGCPAADQRGTTRPQAKTCDIGAFETGGPDLAVTLRAAQAKRDDRAAYDATITNNGAQSALGAYLVSKVPAETGMVKLKGCKHTKMRPNKTATNTRKKKYGCPLGRIRPGESVDVRINFEPKRKGRLVTKTRGKNPLGDVNPADNSASAKIQR